MYAILSDLLSDRKGGSVFTCFGIWHILYMLVIFGTILGLFLALRKKSQETKQRTADTVIGFAFGLYMLDFFLMPFAYGEIDLEKLPFHACTAMCVLCFFSRHNRWLSKFQTQFAMLGLISNLVYVIYPAGVGWYAIHPLSYRVVQTLMFHGIMSAYGILVLAFEEVDFKWKTCCRDLLVTVGMTAWALLGNTLYNGTYGDYDHFFNWFFVVRDPFYILPENIAPFVMPVLVTALFFAVMTAARAARAGIGKLTARHST